MRLPTSLPGHTHAAAFVHVSHLMGGVHQRGGRRAAHRAAHRGAVGPERSGRSILKLTSLCRCAGPREAAFCILRAMRHRGCNGISGRVFEHSEDERLRTSLVPRARAPTLRPTSGKGGIIIINNNNNNNYTSFSGPLATAASAARSSTTSSV